jgi:hypothetical protein
MAEMARQLSKLKAHWEKEGISFYPGLNNSEIAAFEQAQKVCLPDDLREYYRHFNGCDDAYFRFLRLTELEHPSTIPRQADISHYDLSKREFVIVDYLQYCYWYTVDLSDPSAKESPVYISGTLNNHVVARSFSDFLKLYLDDDKSLHPSLSDNKQ